MKAMNSAYSARSMLPEIGEAEAPPEIAALYADIRATLRVPMVNLIYRYMATMPTYLEHVWPQLKTNLQTDDVEQAAEAMRRAATVGGYPAFPLAALDLLGINAPSRTEITRVLDAYNSANPKGLLVVTALRRALDGVPMDSHSVAPTFRTTTQDSEPPTGTLPPMIVLDQADASTRALLADITATRPSGAQPGAPDLVPSLYRHLARWPTFLAVAWIALKPQFTTGVVDEKAATLMAMAGQTVDVLPYPICASREDVARRGYPPPDADQIATTWDRFIPNIARMIVLGHTLRAMMPAE